MIDPTLTPLESPLEVATARRGLSIGLPKVDGEREHRFPMTPQAVAMLTERGYRVYLEAGAAESIHYTDNQYAAAGARITSRAEAFRADMVMYLAPLTPAEVRSMRRGSMLFTFLQIGDQPPETLRELLRQRTIAIAIELIEDREGNTCFADILAEIEGRASVAIASSLLADGVHGKGILLGGVAGVIPCEVTIIGSGIAAVAAARSASGLGAIVKMFDDDVYSLRRASRELGPSMIGSSLHPRVFASALRTADVVIATDTASRVLVSADDVSIMKRGVVAMDVSRRRGVFPSLPEVNLADPRWLEDPRRRAGRVVYVNAGNSVPRTASMALSDTFLTMLEKIISCDGVSNALKLIPGLQKAVFTFLGKAVNPAIARRVGVRHVDISLFLTFS